MLYTLMCTPGVGCDAQEHRGSKVIVYMLTCACVDFFATVLGQLPEAAGLRLVTLHGRMKQAAREAHLADYAAGEAGEWPL
jgi:ATP-dependent RNA helicase DDX55/SPB4